jgi:hypothetical protein
MKSLVEKQKPTVPELLRAERSASDYFDAPSYDKNAAQWIVNDDERYFLAVRLISV